jgi:hypothetical protein
VTFPGTVLKIPPRFSKYGGEPMKTTLRTLFPFLPTLALGATLLAAPARAADKEYQVTGPVLEVNDASITVQKGKEKWQIARTKDTKVTGDPKVGAKVTIMYTMTATSIEAKEAKGGAKEAPAKK